MLVPLLRGIEVRPEPADGRPHEDEVPYSVRVLEREVEHGPSPHRAANEMHPVQAQKVQETAQVFVVGERSLHHLGPSEAAQIVADHRVVVGEGGDLTLPHPAVRDPRVHEDKRLAFSYDFVVDVCAVDLRRARLPKHLFPFPTTLTTSLFPSAEWYSGARVLPCFRRDIFSEDASVTRVGQGQYTPPAPAPQEGSQRPRVYHMGVASSERSKV